MLKLEDLFFGSDLVANVFKKSLLKIGQFSTDYIFSINDLNALHGEIFQKLIDPLMQFCDCKIRIKDFNKLTFIYIFILKDYDRNINRNKTDTTDVIYKYFR